ncbi:hypothetical protein OIDMADRAFT_24324 [Oidiodendron maius Zn]|uniref:Uncharacterized protein n=1 Tax=Oidiodendron maius (strain Zn) TaxID=913774 RepID=A0A0C3D3W3_OIDMZ|nr:hypothetical protein OIDMADRAFT_24324 [Oidiodendron maius Zn]
MEGKVTTIHQTYTVSNTFSFGGDEAWSPLYRFLKDIGSNRVLLRNVSIEMAELYKWLHQDQYGARILTHHGSPALFSPVYSSAHPLVLGVTVLWNCRVWGPRDFLAKEADSIQAKGWEIVEATK